MRESLREAGVCCTMRDLLKDFVTGPIGQKVKALNLTATGVSQRLCVFRALTIICESFHIYICMYVSRLQYTDHTLTLIQFNSLSSDIVLYDRSV